MTTETTDTLDALMARYVAGTLPYPAHVLVQSHLELKPANRGFVRGLEAMAGVALDEIASDRPIANRDRRLDAIFASTPPAAPPIIAVNDQVMPRALRDFVGFDVADIPWRTKLPGFREYDVGDIDGCHVSMFWIRPGRPIPSHTHEGSELSLVLDGAFSDIHGRYGRGDISIADETIDHRPVAEKDRPCIGFAVTDAPLRFTGSLRQRLSDLLGA
jgi:putative transcriptional regulator